MYRVRGRPATKFVLWLFCYFLNALHDQNTQCSQIINKLLPVKKSGLCIMLGNIS